MTEIKAQLEQMFLVFSVCGSFFQAYLWKLLLVVVGRMFELMEIELLMSLPHLKPWVTCILFIIFVCVLKIS